MADPSTPNPSDPEKPPRKKLLLTPRGEKPPEEDKPVEAEDLSTDDGEDGPPKLKLKQLLTPLSPHLTAPRRDRDPRLDKKEAPVPTPHAVPIKPEPEPEPAPSEGPVAAEGAEPGAVEAPAAPREIETSPPTREELGLPPEEEGENAPAEPSEKPEEAAKKAVRKPAPPARRGKKGLLILLLPVIIVAAILFLAQYLFDPLGLKIEPIEELPDPSLVRRTAEPEAPEPSTNAGSRELADAIEDQSLADYLARLEGLGLTVSDNPEGLFIGSVFFQEGGMINPELGLQLQSILPEASVVVLADRSGNTYRIAL